jgi:LuxR family transcriptional regulator, activator of conjugal transfer of Ti plasmids
MSSINRSFQEFVDALQIVDDEIGFERVGTRVAQRLGFRWFAYLRIMTNQPKLISSYPKSWTSRYFDLRYQELDPVVRRASREHGLFGWGRGGSAPTGTREQRRFFEEAMTFGIRSGITIPIRAGFGQSAAFTLATDQAEPIGERFMSESRDVLQLVGLYFHSHVSTRRTDKPVSPGDQTVLSQRERQCLSWAARGKTVADIAILVEISPRTVTFHLANARRKLNASSIAHAVAEAIRRGLLP